MTPQQQSVVWIMLLQTLTDHGGPLSTEVLRATLDVHGLWLSLPGLETELRKLADKKHVIPSASPLNPKVQRWRITDLGQSVLKEMQGGTIVA